MTAVRRLDWAALVNARDVGGYPTTDGRSIRWGALVRSDSLSSLTPPGRHELIAYGVRTVIDLRMPMEIERAPNPFADDRSDGIRYHNVSFIDPAVEPPSQTLTLAEDYQGMLRRFRAQIAAVITTVARSGDGGVLIHCAAGKDRTGLIVGLLLGALGVAPEVVAEDYGLSAEGLRAEEDRWLDEGPGDRADREATLERVRARPEVMLEVLDHVEGRYGGIVGYLEHAGVAIDDVERLRDRFVAPAGSPRMA